jgi:lysozyme family protein
MMADFTKAYKITILGNEGGYNPGIGEKETYRGIDRGANPQWGGWPIIDDIKKSNPNLNTGKMDMLLFQNISLQSNIEKFYKANYWDIVNLDNVTDQQLANNLFDCSVNQGTGRARQFMQIACNYVIASQKSTIKPLIIDKQIGPATLFAFNSLPPAMLNTEINIEREASYRTDAGYAEWAKVWAKRLINYT